MDEVATAPSAPRQAPASNHVYVLFTGSTNRPRGGVGDLAGVFRREEDARDAFRQVRLGSSSPEAWGQLAVLDPGGRVTPLCWFGPGSWQHRPAAGRPEGGESSARRAGTGLLGRRRRRPPRWATPPTGLR